MLQVRPDRTMRAALIEAPGEIRVGDRPYPVVVAPTDAVVRVVLTCVCGGDLWQYRGESPFEPGPIPRGASGKEAYDLLENRLNRSRHRREGRDDGQRDDSEDDDVLRHRRSVFTCEPLDRARQLSPSGRFPASAF